MKKIFLLTLVTMMMAVEAYAVPAKPGLKRVLTLSDGTQVEAQLVGDEHGHYWLARDGRTLVASERAGVFRFADVERLKADAQVRREAVNEQRAQRLERRKVGSYGDYFGKKRGLIILVNFSDVSFESGHDKALYERIANEKNFHEGNFQGSMYDYFYAQSMGQFELEFDIVGPVTVSNTQSYYGRNNYQGNDMRPGEMAREACELADVYVDYSKYDWDGDREVDQVYIVYAGKGEADGGADDTIWPHAWDLRSATGSSLTLDGVRINTYACGGELEGQTGDINGIGTMCHEFSHCLGYPDFYDTDHSGGQGMAYWDLMDAGSYNGNGYLPAGYTSYERWVVGWLEPIELTDSVSVAGMEALQKGGDAYIMYNDAHPDEYFLLENRQHVGWDRGVPGHGLLILHVDYKASSWKQNNPNNSPKHQRMTWIPADGTYESYGSGSYKRYTFEGMRTDTYPSGSNDSFGNDSRPAATLYNENLDGTKLLNKEVYDIRERNGTISFSFASFNSEKEPLRPTGDGDYKRVFNYSTLTPDATYLLVCEETDSTGVAFAGVTEKSGISCGQSTPVSIDGFTIASADAQAKEVKLQDAGGGSWYITCDDRYLGFEGRYGSLTTAEQPTASGYRWTVSPEAITNASYGMAQIRLQYNPESTMQVFGCYAKKHKDLVLYMKENTEPAEREPANLSFEVESITLEAGTPEFAAPELVNPNGLDVVYSSGDETLATVDDMTGEVTLGNTPGSVVITATFEGDEYYLPGSASYTIVITQPSAIGETERGASASEHTPVYDLSGRKIVNRQSADRPLPKGIYICGGRKVVVR